MLGEACLVEGRNAVGLVDVDCFAFSLNDHLWIQFVSSVDHFVRPFPVLVCACISVRAGVERLREDDAGQLRRLSPGRGQGTCVS